MVKLIRHSNGTFSCLPCMRKMEVVRGKGNKGKRRCPACGFQIKLPDRNTKKRFLKGGKRLRPEGYEEGENFYGQ